MREGYDNILIISIKPEFAEKIFNGNKTIELRKASPKKVNINDYVIIYVTSPIKEIWGICKINRIIKDSPEEFWVQYGQETGISKHQFSDYYKSNKIAYGIELKDIKSFFKYSIDLETVKSAFPKFKPPQTYSYIKKEEINFKILKKILNKIE